MKKRKKENNLVIPYYMYVVVRRDLSPEQQSVQSIHAAIESTKIHLKKDITPHVILLSIKNEKNLVVLMMSLRLAGIKCEAFCEPDKNNEITAFSTNIFVGKTDIFRNIEGLKLLRYGISDVTVNRFRYKY